MKEKRLLNVFGEVDDKFIEGSAPKNISEKYSFEQNYSVTEKPNILSVKQQKNPVFLRAISAVAACAVAVGLVFAVKFIVNRSGKDDFINPGDNDLIDQGNTGSSFSEFTSSVPQSTHGLPENSKPAIEYWGNSAKYFNLNFNNAGYRNVQDMLLDKGDLGELLEDATAWGEDKYDHRYETTVSVYKIKDIAKNVAVAVKFSDDENYYFYNNFKYIPETLGDLVSDLNLKEKMNSLKFIYVHLIVDENDYKRIWKYEAPEPQIIFDYLLSHADVKPRTTDISEWRDVNYHFISFEAPGYIDYDANAFKFNESGDVYIRLLNGEPMLFNIGADKTNEFIKYVKENCDGGKSDIINYSDSDEEDSKPEESKPEESKPEESKPEDANSVIIKGIEYNIETTTKLKLFEVTDENLKQIGKLTNLTNLELGGDFSDLTPLAGLTKLTSLYLSSSKISDLTPLSSLTNLTILNLKNNTRLVDITPLAQLTNLKELCLAGSKISDLTPLASLTNMEELWLVGNQITDITPLSGLTNLLYLHLDSNDISDITPIAKLTNLIKLSLRDNDISNLTQLTGLAALSSLDLSRNKISDIAPLAKLTNLAYLDLGNNQISDIKPLAELKNLMSLTLGNNKISDITPLANLTNLEHLDLGFNQISGADVAWLKEKLPDCSVGATPELY